MLIGKLRHKIDILTRKETMLEGAHNNIAFFKLYSCYADISPVSGYVSFDTKQISETITHKIIIRYHANVTTENWIGFKKKRYRIRSVTNDDERNRWLVLLCEQHEVVLDLLRTEVGRVDDEESQLG